MFGELMTEATERIWGNSKSLNTIKKIGFNCLKSSGYLFKAAKETLKNGMRYVQN